MKYLIYYFLPDIILYNIIEETISDSVYFITNSYTKRCPLGIETFDEFKRLSKDEKLKCIDNYVNSNKFFKKINENFYKIISFIITTIISIIRLFVK